jgi:hypothetical protein
VERAVRLDDNAYLDRLPKLAGPLENGDLLVALTVNTSNVLAGATSDENALTTDSVMWSRGMRPARRGARRKSFWTRWSIGIR